MKVTINFNGFERAFYDCGRGKQFSYGGLQALFEYLELLESDINEDIENETIVIPIDKESFIVANF